MPTWTPIAGRVLSLLSIAGLAAVALLGGSAWAVVLLVGAGLGGLMLVHRAAGAPAESSLGSLRQSLQELEALTGNVSSRLNTDTTTSGLVADAARRIQDAAARLKSEIAGTGVRHESLRSLLDAVDEPILATDGQGIIQTGNAAAQRLLGLRGSNLLGRPVEEVFTQPEIPRVIALAAAGTPVQEEVRVSRPEGVRMWEVSAVPFGPGPAPGSPSAVVLTLRDATERSLSLQVKTDFVANASHELRTPISAIRTAVETLETLGEDDDAMRRRLLGMLGAHTLRLEELVRDLLDLSRLESTGADLKSETFAASLMASSLAPVFQGVCTERGLTLAFDLAPELEHLRTDRNLLLLILSNLIDNACKFAFKDTEVRVVGRPSGRGARFEVIDRGIGIPLSQQQRVFERFFQVDQARTGGARRGTGLGLSIVKHAVRRLGGSIRVNSVWQQGTTMTVDIPSAIEPSPDQS